jgi:hypothetical protein
MRLWTAPAAGNAKPAAIRCLCGGRFCSQKGGALVMPRLGMVDEGKSRPKGAGEPAPSPTMTEAGSWHHPFNTADTVVANGVVGRPISVLSW